MSADERVAQRRERLLDAGVALFAAKGFAATGVKDVCGQAGLTDRYFYESFADREALLVAAIDRITERLFELTASAVLAAAPDPEAQARAAIGTYVRTLADEPAAARVLFVEAPAGGAEVERHMRATLRRFADLVAATARPHFPTMPEEVLRLAAFAIVGAIERLMIEWQEGELELSIEQLVEGVVALFLAAGVGAGLDLGKREAKRERKGKR